MGGGTTNVTIAFKDFFGCYVGRIVKQGRVVEDGLKIFGNLGESQVSFYKEHLGLTYFAHLVIVLYQCVDNFDGKEAAFILAHDRALFFKDVGCYDSGKIVSVHFAAGFLIHL